MCVHMNRNIGPFGFHLDLDHRINKIGKWKRIKKDTIFVDITQILFSNLLKGQ